jgi:hypothetical protein
VETAAQRAEREWRERCSSTYIDMYIGKGLNDPPVVTRLDRLEKSVNEIMMDIKESQNRRETKLNILLVAVLSLVTGIILNHFKII